MAIGLVPQRAATSAAKFHCWPSSAKPAARFRPYSSFRSRTVFDSLPPPEKTTAPIRGAAPEPKTTVTTEQRDSPDSKRSRGTELSTSDPVTLLLGSIRSNFRRDGLGLEILSIALPAALALAADPITSLVDTAFVGHIGSDELAAVGVSASVFNLVSKLFNVPLLNITTSFVAEEQALDDKGNDFVTGPDNGVSSDHHKKKLLPSVSTSLALATCLGIAETVALSAGSSFLMNIMGIPADSPMRIPAEQFITLRAFGAPAIVIALAAQGTFRGFKDTKTPVYAIGAGNLLNAVLDPILIFLFGLGIGGAAVATVISEYLIAFILLWKLNEEVLLISPNIDGKRVLRYLKSGGLLIGRTLSVLITMTLATSMAAREGPVPMAGYQICTEVWLALSMLTDALAIAGQALLARDYSKGDYAHARQVIYMVLQIGMGTGIALGTILFIGFGAFASLFTGDSEVLEIARSGLLAIVPEQNLTKYMTDKFVAQFVAGSQPINAIAFVMDGLYYGASDFGYAAYSMVIVGLVSSAFLVLVAPQFGLPGIWAGLFLFMTLRVVAGVWRLGTRGGPWKMIWEDSEHEQVG